MGKDMGKTVDEGNGTVKWFCVEGCANGAGCKHRHDDGSCVYEYDAAKTTPAYRWMGIGPPPRRWRAIDGTVVYRSFSDYCD